MHGEADGSGEASGLMQLTSSPSELTMVREADNAGGELAMLVELKSSPRHNEAEQ